MVYIEGKLQTRKWEKDGVTRYTTEVIVNEMTMLGGKSSGGGSFEVVDKPPASAEHAAAPASKKPVAAAKSNFDNFDDDIPF